MIYVETRSHSLWISICQCGLWHYGPQDPITDAKILGSKLLVFFVETNPMYPGWWFGTWPL